MLTWRVYVGNVHLQTLSVMSVTLGTPRFQYLRSVVLKHVEDSFNRAQEYVIATFEVRYALQVAVSCSLQPR